MFVVGFGVLAFLPTVLAAPASILNPYVVGAALAAAAIFGS